jgi:hypothetical protein
MTSENPTRFPRRAPWNKGRLIRQKRPLKPKDVWTIRCAPPTRAPPDSLSCARRAGFLGAEPKAFLPYISHAYAFHTIPVAIKGSYIGVEVRV